jgi:hypothetical protein
MLAAIRTGLAGSYPTKLVDELLAAYREAKERFYAGGLRLSEVEGGRFCEAAFRMLQHRAGMAVTPIGHGHTLPSDTVIQQLQNQPKGSLPDSVRIHIPRALRVVYDVRNNRDAAHLADGIDPNLQDASVVVAVLDWVMAEFVRLHHSVSADEAAAIVNALVTRRAPAVQTFDTFRKVLRTDLKATDFALLLLYECDKGGATFDDLRSWVRPSMRANVRRTLRRLEHDLALIHCTGERFVITDSGRMAVERRRLHAPAVG